MAWKDRGVHIVFCVDKRGLKHFAVTATSVAVNMGDRLAGGYLLSNDVTDQDVRSFFTFLRSTYGLDLKLISVDQSLLEVFPVHGHVTSAAYIRLVFGEVLPHHVETALYVDSDLVVNADISAQLSDAVAAMAADHAVIAAAPEIPTTFEHLQEIGAIGDSYFQSGVMVINMPRWRQEISVEQFVSLREKYRGHIRWWDQDILNLAFAGKWVPLPLSLNGTPHRRTSETLVYHYAGNQKPWVYGSEVADADTYEKYRRLTHHLRPLKTTPSTVVDFYMVRFRQVFRTLYRSIARKR